MGSTLNYLGDQMTTADNINGNIQHIAKMEDRRSHDLPKDLFQYPEEFNDLRMPGKSPSNPDSINEMEPITKISVPKEWNKAVNEAGFGEMAKSVSFTPPEGDGAELALYDRGFPIAKSEGDKFRAVLEKEPHVLDAKEIDSLTEQVLGTIGDKSAFDIKNAETKIVNGKKVLAVEGDWKDGGKKFYGCYIPKDENFRQIQEVYFEGTEPNFTQLKPQALKSISSIQWK